MRLAPNTTNTSKMEVEGEEEEEEDSEETATGEHHPFEATDAYSAEWVASIMTQNAKEEGIITQIAEAAGPQEVAEIAGKYLNEKQEQKGKPSFAFVRAVGERLVVAAAAKEAGFVKLWDSVVMRLFNWKKAPVTYSYAPRLIQLCMDSNFVRGIEDCLRHLRDIPDEPIAKLIAYVVDLPDEVPATMEVEKKGKVDTEGKSKGMDRKKKMEVEEEEEEEEKEIESVNVFSFEGYRPRNYLIKKGFLNPKEYLLSLIILLPRNEVFAHKYIKSFSKQNISVY